MKGTAPFALVVLSALIACKSGDDKSAPATTGAAGTATPPSVPAATAPTAPTPGAAPTATATAAAPKAGGEYPTDSLKTIADNCSSAAALIASVPKKVKDGWKDGQEWNWAVQALLAHQEFSLVDDATKKPMDVKFLQYEPEDGDAVNLVAACQDGATCNKLAAMYKFTVPGAKPQLFCGGKVPGTNSISVVVPKLTQFGGADAKLPEEENVVGRCARLHICSRKLDRSTADDMGLSCQRAPGKHKTACAAKKTCDDVVSCMKG